MLVCLHGGRGNSGDYFFPYLSPLAEELTMVYLDERGSGGSKPVPDKRSVDYDGMITHRIRQFKLCRAVDTFALTYMNETDERGLRQDLAHTAAFNSGSIGCVGFPAHMNCGCDFRSNYDLKRAFVSWLNEHREFFRDTHSAAQIAMGDRRAGNDKWGRGVIHQL